MEKSKNPISNNSRRTSEREMAMRRTTLPLHSFLTPGELSLYYILDRFPVRNRFGIGDRGEVAVISQIMGCSIAETDQAIDGLVRLGIIQPQGTDTTWMESIINFPALFEFCTRLGQHPVGFGACLRNVTGFKNIQLINASDYGLAEKAYRALEGLTHACTDDNKEVVDGQNRAD